MIGEYYSRNAVLDEDKCNNNDFYSFIKTGYRSKHVSITLLWCSHREKHYISMEKKRKERKEHFSELSEYYPKYGRNISNYRNGYYSFRWERDKHK